MYKEGDQIPGLGIVEWNHCGLPWPGHQKGILCGVVQVRKKDLTSVWLDALCGKELNETELELRLNNLNFDYAHKMQSRELWEKANQPYGPFYYLYQKNSIEAWWYRMHFRKDAFFRGFENLTYPHKKFRGLQFFHWDDGRRAGLVLWHWRFGWENQQQGFYLFLGPCYLAWAYC